MKDGTFALVSCKSQKTSDCPSCAKIYQNDQKRLIGSGCNTSERDGITEEMLVPFRFYFVTLTAPSFGAIHRVPKSEKTTPVACVCKKTHSHGSKLRGTPVNIRYYKYRDQIDWNVASSELFRRTLRYTSDLLPDLEWSFAREWQVRGALHLHGIIRVPSSYDEAKTSTALMKMRTYKYENFGWGSEFDVKMIRDDDTSGSVRYMSKVVSYTAKQQGDEGIISETRRAYYEKLDWHSARIICSTKGCKGDGTCVGKRHRSFGYSGVMISWSKGWSLANLDRASLALERKEFAENNRTVDYAAKLKVMAAAFDDERKSSLQELGTGKINAVWDKKLLDSFLGKTAGESISYTWDEIEPY